MADEWTLTNAIERDGGWLGGDFDCVLEGNAVVDRDGIVRDIPDVVVDDPTGPDGTQAVRGAVFESKGGRRAVLAPVVVDATGDGDLFHRAGAASAGDVDERDIHHCINTAWLFGGVDMPAHLRWRAEKPDEFSEFMRTGRERMGLLDKAFVSWRDDVALFMGPRLAGFSGLDADDQTAWPIYSRFTWWQMPLPGGTTWKLSSALLPHLRNS